jgi:hypothetical protein
VAFVIFSEPLSCGAVRLARKTSGDDVNSSSVNSEVCFCDVMVAYRLRPIVLQNTLTKFIPFAMENILPPHYLGGIVKASYP